MIMQELQKLVTEFLKGGRNTNKFPDFIPLQSLDEICEQHDLLVVSAERFHILHKIGTKKYFGMGGVVRHNMKLAEIHPCSEYSNPANCSSDHVDILSSQFLDGFYDSATVEVFYRDGPSESIKFKIYEVDVALGNVFAIMIPPTNNEINQMLRIIRQNT